MAAKTYRVLDLAGRKLGEKELTSEQVESIRREGELRLEIEEA